MTAEAQLERFIEKFDPERQRLLRAVRKKLRKRFPSATELVYDNYNFVGRHCVSDRRRQRRGPLLHPWRAAV